MTIYKDINVIMHSIAKIQLSDDDELSYNDMSCERSGRSGGLESGSRIWCFGDPGSSKAASASQSACVSV